MTIRYRVIKRKDTLNNTDATRYIMQSVNTGAVAFDRISYEISNECTLRETVLMVVLNALGKKLQEHLAEGGNCGLTQYW